MLKTLNSYFLDWEDTLTSQEFTIVLKLYDLDFYMQIQICLAYV